MNADNNNPKVNSLYTEDIEDAPPSIADHLFSFLRKILPLILLVIIALFVWEIMDEDERAMVETLEEGVRADEMVAMDPQAFRKLYVDRNDGINRIRSMRDLRLDGRIIEGEESRDFFTIRQFPGRILARLYDEDVQISFGATDDDRWTSFREGTQVVRVEDISAEEAGKVFKEFHPLHDLLLHQIAAGTDSIMSVQFVERDGESAILVEQTPTLNETKVEYVFTADELLPVEKRAHYQDGSYREWVFSNHRLVGGTRLPYRIESFLNGELVSEMEIIRIRQNVGVVTLTFERPAVNPQ